eukprot:7825968-Pyramimonas_sp.AAC.1
MDAWPQREPDGRGSARAPRLGHQLPRQRTQPPTLRMGSSCAWPVAEPAGSGDARHGLTSR